MGFWQKLVNFFRGGPSKEELARQEALRREKEEALRQQALMQARLKAMEEENRRKEEALKAEKAARALEERKRLQVQAEFDKKMKTQEEELNSKYTQLMEGMEKKMDQSLKKKETSIKKMESDLKKKISTILSEQDEAIEQTIKEVEKQEEEIELLAIEKEMMEKEQERLKEKELEIARRQEALRIEKQKTKFGERPGLGMTEDEKEELASVLGTYTFDNFVVGPNNRFPREAAFTVARSPANAYNPFFMYSNVGLGKTHLLSAIGNYIMEKHPGMRVAYLTTERFTNELLKAVAGNDLESFREQYRHIDVLLIDDIQFLGKQEQTQTEFFHTFNTLYNNHKQIVLASDRPPQEIATLESRLQSRFEGGLITQIKPPDRATRIHILQDKAKDEGIDVSEDVVNFLAERISSNVRTLLGALNRVTAYANLTSEPCTVAMASEVLGDMLGESAEA